ncbi:MAG TPA: DUF3943 domain-containing protein [Polyangiaceae bacterium]|nr:DUF3943 domain-containing protein [Polyangiaceae bacterium]
MPVAHTAALFTGMRLTEAYLWPSPFAESPAKWGKHYADAFTQPPVFHPDRRAFEWDGDRYTINVFGHGLLGSELFYRARRCNSGFWGALLFATSASAVWEYGFEANGVRPSALDLVYTPIAGLALGEARYWGQHAARSIHSPGVRWIVTALLDPFGEFERGLGAPC